MIKPAFEALHPSSNNSFLIRKFEEVAFSAPYHFHPEYELTLILKGEGKRYVGNHMAPYVPGDLVFLGSNLPHCWKTESDNTGGINACSIVIQFNYDFFGKTFLNKAEMEPIAQLLKKGNQGVQFHKETSITIKQELILLYKETDPFNRMMMFLNILNQLGRAKDIVLLNQQEPGPKPSPSEREKVNAVLAYIVENFKDEISLEEAAAIAGMTLNAFCKYYKRLTRKTFMETVIDYRINYATQQLIQTDKPVSEICFDCGFGDVSHFYKLFKRKMLLSPLKYRKKFMIDMMKY